MDRGRPPGHSSPAAYSLEERSPRCEARLLMAACRLLLKGTYPAPRGASGGVKLRRRVLPVPLPGAEHAQRPGNGLGDSPMAHRPIVLRPTIVPDVPAPSRWRSFDVWGAFSADVAQQKAVADDMMVLS